MDRLGGLVVIAPARRARDSGSSPGPDEIFSLKLLISTFQMVILKAKIIYTYISKYLLQQIVTLVYHAENFNLHSK